MAVGAAPRNQNLDALRAIAVLMVMGRHFPYFSYWSRIGWAGVDIFFVLSGYLVSGLLFNGYRRDGRIRPGNFYIRRGLKIWPSLYALIAVGILVAFLTHHPIPTSQLLSELFFLQSYVPSMWGITWSVAVEEHFYLILPLLLLLIHREPRENASRGDASRDKKPFSLLPVVFLAIAIFSLTCRFLSGWNETGFNFFAYLMPTHLRIDGLMFGVLLSYYKHFHPEVFHRIACWRGGWLVMGFALAVLIYFPQNDPNMHTWGFTVLYIGAGFLVARAVTHDGPRPVRAISGMLAKVGLYSYSIYLWHMFVLLRVMPHLPLPGKGMQFVTYIFLCFGLGIVMAKLIEMPVLSFRDRVFPSLSSSGVRGNRPANVSAL